MKRKLSIFLAMAAVMFAAVSCNNEKDPVLEPTYTGANVAAAGGKATIKVKSNIDWKATNSDSWVTEIKPAEGKGDGDITVTFAANTGSQERSSTFTLKGKDLTKTVVIKQSGATESLTVEYTATEISGEGGTATFTIKSNMDWTIVAQNAAWLTPNPASGNGDTTVTVAVAANDGAAREGVLKVSAGSLSETVTIKQAAGTSSALTVDYTPVDIPGAGGTATFTVKSNTDWTVTAEGGATWLTPNPASGSGDATVSVAVAANDGAARQGTLNVTAGSIVVPVVINQLEAYAGGTNTLFSFVVNGGDFPTFDDMNTFFKSNFTLIDKDGDGFNWRTVLWVDENEVPTGEYGVLSESWDSVTKLALTPENYLVLPAVTINSDGRFTAVFYSIEDEDYFYEKFKIIISSEPITSANCRNAAVLLTQTLPEGGKIPYTAEVEIPAEYNGSPAYLAICHFDCPDQHYIVLESITITHNGPAPVPALYPAPAATGNHGINPMMYQSLKAKN